jgi:hypothetical protein
MRKNLFTPLITAAFILAISIISCKKENSQSGTLTPEEEKQVASLSAESEAEADVIFDDIFNNTIGVSNEVGISGLGIFGQANLNGGLPTGRTDSIRCYTVSTIHTSTTSFFPVKIIIDFGIGCKDRFGITRSGKIITIYSGNLTKPGSTATTTLENFIVDSIKVEGSQTIKNTTGTTAGSNQNQFTIDVEAKLIKPNDNYSRWKSHKVRTQVEGNGTPLIGQDDIFRVTGEANGQVRFGNLVFAWNSRIVEPLFKKYFCRWVSKGTIRTRRENLPGNSPYESTLDYGNGLTCDNKATLIINGVTHQITLH